jgi:hypothetical protein
MGVSHALARAGHGEMSKLACGYYCLDLSFADMLDERMDSHAIAATVQPTRSAHIVGSTPPARDRRRQWLAPPGLCASRAEPAVLSDHGCPLDAAGPEGPEVRPESCSVGIYRPITPRMIWPCRRALSFENPNGLHNPGSTTDKSPFNVGLIMMDGTLRAFLARGLALKDVRRILSLHACRAELD